MYAPVPRPPFSLPATDPLPSLSLPSPSPRCPSSSPGATAVVVVVIGASGNAMPSTKRPSGDGDADAESNDTPSSSIRVVEDDATDVPDAADTPEDRRCTNSTPRRACQAAVSSPTSGGGGGGPPPPAAASGTVSVPAWSSVDNPLSPLEFSTFVCIVWSWVVGDIDEPPPPASLSAVGWVLAVAVECPESGVAAGVSVSAAGPPVDVDGVFGLMASPDGRLPLFAPDAVRLVLIPPPPSLRRTPPPPPGAATGSSPSPSDGTGGAGERNSAALRGDRGVRARSDDEVDPADNPLPSEVPLTPPAPTCADDCALDVLPDDGEAAVCARPRCCCCDWRFGDVASGVEADPARLALVGALRRPGLNALAAEAGSVADRRDGEGGSFCSPSSPMWAPKGNDAAFPCFFFFPVFPSLSLLRRSNHAMMSTTQRLGSRRKAIARAPVRTR
eukprot:m.183661 g.183661  ORF g.183661 m.183661 type:complete len:445 (-) comp15901_c0_seq1:344-1678(-)